MSVELVSGGNPTFTNGKLEPGGGQHLDRIRTLAMNLRLRPEPAGTLPTALCIEITRDASQGSPADLLLFKQQFGTGRAEKSVVPLTIFLIDDVRRGRKALIGKFVCTKTVLVGTHVVDDVGSPVQTALFRASEFTYFNAISGQFEPNDPALVPVIVPAFDEQPDAVAAQ